MRLPLTFRCAMVALGAVALPILLTRTASAQVVFSLSPSSYNIGSTGSINLTGYIINNSSDTVSLNRLRVASFGVVGGEVDTDSFFDFVPATLSAGGSYGSPSAPQNIVTVRTNNAPDQMNVPGDLRLDGGGDMAQLMELANASFQISVIPEPGTFPLLGAGMMAGLAGVVVRRKTRR